MVRPSGAVAGQVIQKSSPIAMVVARRQPVENKRLAFIVVVDLEGYGGTSLYIGLSVDDLQSVL